MRPVLFGLVAVGLGVLSGCGRGASVPLPGETISPVLEGTPKWTAGQATELSVRLQAQGADDAAPRSLDFTGVPANVNPVARITFYEGDQAQKPVELNLSHRC